jgi:signal transduction histidine kinase
VAGKNRLLTSQFLNEVKDSSYLKLSDADPENKLNQLEQNILFLKYGGIEDRIQLQPLDEKFNNDWEQVYSNFQNLKSNFEKFKSLDSKQSLSPFDITSLEIDSLMLIAASDVLVYNLGLEVDNSSTFLIGIQIVLLIVNVTVHVFLILLISKIFRNEYDKKLKTEKLATIGELSSRLVHDIKNPLSVIDLATQLLKSKSTEDETSQKLELIEKGIKSMSNQINDVMDFVRSKQPELKLWDLNSILEECINRLRIPDSVKVTLPKKSILVKCDRNQFEVVFINLISNALDAIDDDGSIEIRATTSSLETKIEVIDSGEGVSKDKLDLIFEPLITYKKTGTGLGLASCKNIVENHKGKISFKNNPTTFTIVLPNS